MTAEGSGAAPAALAPAVRTRSFMLLLVALTATAPLSLQIFIPALPAIQTGFRVSTGTAQLVLSLSILANAFANLVYGPFSDRLGRRPVVLAGLAAFFAGSVVSALAPSIAILIFGRIVQAIGAAAGMVLARAIVRDLYERDRAASMIAYLTMAMVVAPMLAPLIGAVLTDLFGWRSIFVFVAILAALLGWQSNARLIETHPVDPGTSRPGSMLAGAGYLLRQGPFQAYALQATFSISVFFAFIAGGPYFMIDVLGRSATEYGVYFVLVSAGFMAGNFVAARRSGRIGLDRMILIGSITAFAGTVLAALLVASWSWHPLALFGPMTAVAFANGLSVPNAQAGAVSVNPALAGTASGLTGFLQMFTAAVVSQAVGVVQDGTPYPMIAFMLACSLLALLGFVLPRRLPSRPG